MASPWRKWKTKPEGFPSLEVERSATFASYDDIPTIVSIDDDRHSYLPLFLDYYCDYCYDDGGDGDGDGGDGDDVVVDREIAKKIFPKPIETVEIQSMNFQTTDNQFQNDGHQVDHKKSNESVNPT